MRNLLDQGGAGKVKTIVTSPPYWNLRDYGVAGQIGMEPTLQEFVATMVEVFDLARELLSDDGTLWLNLGDSYSANHGSGAVSPGLKPKDLCGVPWRVAFALQEAGWYLRQDIIWCLSGGAWIYARTQKGDMPVMVKDLVRLKPSTVKLWNGSKWTQVLGWGASNDTNQRLELVLRSGERIGCTGGHLWPTQRGNVAARDLRAGDVIQTCRLPDPATAGAPMYLTRDLLWLIGLYLAEGSRAGDTIQLSLNADETPWLERIEAAADGLGASMTHTKRGSNLSVRLYGRVLAAAIEEFIGGRTAHDKHLRAPVWNLPGWALRCIADGYLDGDGSWDQKVRRWRLGFARNYALERDLRTLAGRLGATVTIQPTVAKYQGGSKPAFRGEWRWGRSGHHNEKDRGEVIEIRASRARKFWDIAVEDDPHLFALASGVLTHNCKPNPMPESVRDRCTKSHEYLFLLTKQQRYYFDFDAFQEPVNGGAHARGPGNRNHSAAQEYLHGDEYHRTKSGLVAYAERQRAKKIKTPDGWDTSKGQGAHGSFHKNGREAGRQIDVGVGHRQGPPGNPAPARSVGVGPKARPTKGAPNEPRVKYNESFSAAVVGLVEKRNRRSVWTIATQSYSEDHFATFPEALVEPCIIAGSRPGDIVFDPFMGSGTVAQVAQRLGRKWIGSELNEEYIALQANRTRQQGLELVACG